jgi:hypothetical protein
MVEYVVVLFYFINSRMNENEVKCSQALIIFKLGYSELIT